MICHTRRKSERKNRKSFLGSTMVNVASHIPAGFSMRHAFTLLFIQLLTISNYLSISRLKSTAMVEAIKIEGINFPSHIEIGLPVSIIKIRFKHKYYSFAIYNPWYILICLHLSNITKVTMTCNYQLQRKESIDSIKWYKDGEEFYRNVFSTSNDRDRVKAYAINGTTSLDRQLSGVGIFKKRLQIKSYEYVTKFATLFCCYE